MHNTETHNTDNTKYIQFKNIEATKYQGRKAPASPCSVIWNFFFEQSTTDWSISWGETCALKFLGFHSFRMSSPNLSREKGAGNRKQGAGGMRENVAGEKGRRGRREDSG